MLQNLRFRIGVLVFQSLALLWIIFLILFKCLNLSVILLIKIGLKTMPTHSFHYESNKKRIKKKFRGASWLKSSWENLFPCHYAQLWALAPCLILDSCWCITGEVPGDGSSSYVPSNNVGSFDCWFSPGYWEHCGISQQDESFSPKASHIIAAVFYGYQPVLHF